MQQDWYYHAIEQLVGNLWTTNPLKVALLKPTYVKDLDNHLTFPQVSAQEITGTGYTAGGQTLVGKAAPYTAASDRTDLQATDVVWTGATFDAGYAAIYDPSGAQTLWALIDFQGVKSVEAGSFTLDFATIGVLYVVKA